MNMYRYVKAVPFDSFCQELGRSETIFYPAYLNGYKPQGFGGALKIAVKPELTGGRVVVLSNVFYRLANRVSPNKSL